MSAHLQLGIHDGNDEGSPKLSASAFFVESEKGNFCYVTIASGDARHAGAPSFQVYSKSPERFRAIANAFLDAAVLLETAKEKAVRA